MALLLQIDFKTTRSMSNTKYSAYLITHLQANHQYQHGVAEYKVIRLVYGSSPICLRNLRLVLFQTYHSTEYCNDHQCNKHCKCIQLPQFVVDQRL